MWHLTDTQSQDALLGTFITAKANATSTGWLCPKLGYRQNPSARTSLNCLAGFPRTPIPDELRRAAVTRGVLRGARARLPARREPGGPGALPAPARSRPPQPPQGWRGASARRAVPWRHLRAARARAPAAPARGAPVKWIKTAPRLNLY